jgi:HEAT repeat protein
VPGPKTKEEALGAALADLQEKDPVRRRQAAAHLARLRVRDNPDVVKALEKLLGDEGRGTRAEAAKALGACNSKASVPALVKLLGENDRETRLAALAALGQLKDPQAAAAIAARLAQDTEAATAALKEIGPAAEGALLAQLKGRDTGLRLKVCRVLKYVATPKSAAALTTLAKDRKDPEVAQAALQILQHDAAVLAAILKIQDTDSTIAARREGIEAIAALEPNGRRAEVARLLESLATPRSVYNQWGLVRTLGEWGMAETTVPVLIRMLDPEERRGGNVEVMNALVRFKDERAVDPCVPYLTSPFDARGAHQALINLGDVAEWPLQKHLKDPNPSIRREVCAVLQAIGTTDSIAALQAAASDADQGVVLAAQAALKEVAERP